MSKYFNWKKKINSEELLEVISILKNNGIIIFPTETVYGIGGNALSDNVIDRIYKVKKRPKFKALNILVSNKNDIEKYAEITSETERKIIEKCMPGPITIILKKKKNFGNAFTYKNDTIGIRIPDNKIIKTILENIEFPIIAPSANISGKPSAIQILDILNDFKDKVDIIIDGGKTNIGLASTIVQVVNEELIIIREGKITKEEILNKIRVE